MLLTHVLSETALCLQDMQENAYYFYTVFDYQEWLLLSLCYRYLIGIPEKRLQLLKILPGRQFSQLRHLLYTDFLDCIWHENKQYKPYYQTHTDSLDFSSEINRYFKPGAKIRRSSLIRLLLIFTMPDTNITLLNQLLELFDFAPLSPDIHTASGISPDLLLIQLLQRFETMKSGNPENDGDLFRQLLLRCDQEVCERLQDYPNAKKGTLLYRKRQQLKDLRIMAPHSLRKEFL